MTNQLCSWKLSLQRLSEQSLLPTVKTEQRAVILSNCWAQSFSPYLWQLLIWWLKSDVGLKVSCSASVQRPSAEQINYQCLDSHYLKLASAHDDRSRAKLSVGPDVAPVSTPWRTQKREARFSLLSEHNKAFLSDCPYLFWQQLSACTPTLPLIH